MQGETDMFEIEPAVLEEMFQQTQRAVELLNGLRLIVDDEGGLIKSAREHVRNIEELARSVALHNGCHFT